MRFFTSSFAVFCLLLTSCNQTVTDTTAANEVLLPTILNEFAVDRSSAQEKWNGQKIQVRGYIFPTTKQFDIKEFALVSTLPSTFGDEPERLLVKLGGGRVIPEYTTDATTVIGKLTVQSSPNNVELILADATIASAR